MDTNTIISVVVGALVAMVGGLGGQMLAGKQQAGRDRLEHLRRLQDELADLDRRTITDLIKALMEVKLSLDAIGLKLHTLPDQSNPSLKGKNIPLDDIVRFRESIVRTEAAQALILDDILNEKVTWAIVGANNALSSFASNDLKTLQETFNAGMFRVHAVIAWSRLLLHGRKSQIDWNNPPVSYTSMLDEGPMHELFRDPTIRATGQNATTSTEHYSQE